MGLFSSGRSRYDVGREFERYDRIRKARLYALAGIPEYWVVGVQPEWVEVYRPPEGEGYRDVKRVPRGDSVAPLSFPDLVIPVDDIFA